MQNQTLDSSLGRLIFRRSDGLLHSLNEQGETLLKAFRKGFSVDDLTIHFQRGDASDDCNQQLNHMFEQWESLGLLNEKQQKLPYQLLLRPGLETIEVTTNSEPLFDYLDKFYESAFTEKDQIMSTISINQSLIDETFNILVNGKKKHQVSHFEEAILATCFEIGEEATHEEPRLLVAHAAALTRKAHTWLLPAQAGSGKSTLTANLIKQGYQLINDDVVPINHNGTATALNLPLKIKSGSWPALTLLHPSLQSNPVILRAGDLQIKNLATPQHMLCKAGSTHRINGLIVPKFDDSQKMPSCEKLSPNQKLQAFLKAEPYFPHRMTRPYLQKVIDWLEPLPAWSICYNSSQQALDMIEQISDDNQI